MSLSRRFTGLSLSPAYLPARSPSSCIRGHPTVLRRKPPGALLSKTAHAIEREHLVLAAIQHYNATASPEAQVPAPKVYGLCEDQKVIGSSFYLMEFVKGRIFGDVRLQELPEKDRKEW